MPGGRVRGRRGLPQPKRARGPLGTAPSAASRRSEPFAESLGLPPLEPIQRKSRGSGPKTKRVKKTSPTTPQKAASRESHQRVPAPPRWLLPCCPSLMCPALSLVCPDFSRFLPGYPAPSCCPLRLLVLLWCPLLLPLCLPVLPWCPPSLLGTSTPPRCPRTHRPSRGCGYRATGRAGAGPAAPSSCLPTEGLFCVPAVPFPRCLRVAWADDLRRGAAVNVI